VSIGGVPAYVLLARLTSELETVRLALRAENYNKAKDGVQHCTSLANDLRRAL